jgi:hypothetical protein
MCEVAKLISINKTRTCISRLLALSQHHNEKRHKNVMGIGGTESTILNPGMALHWSHWSDSRPSHFTPFIYTTAGYVTSSVDSDAVKDLISAPSGNRTPIQLSNNSLIAVPSGLSRLLNRLYAYVQQASVQINTISHNRIDTRHMHT